MTTLSTKAQLANELLPHLAAVLVRNENSVVGERRLLTPQECVTRATEIVEAAWHLYDTKGWIIQRPL